MSDTKTHRIAVSYVSTCGLCDKPLAKLHKFEYCASDTYWRFKKEKQRAEYWRGWAFTLAFALVAWLALANL